MPLADLDLVIEPSYRNASALLDICNKKPEAPHPDDRTVRNTFWSTRYRMNVVIYEEDGIAKHQFMPGQMRATMELNTLGASSAWGLEQEENALALLETLISPHKFKQYILTGMFLETSKRSGLTYLFRKLRPTVVIDNRDRDGKGVHVLCALCLHPVAYYSGSWAGALTPSDDVVSHLMLMRSDEHFYWKRSNQHAPGRPEAGL